MFFASLNGKQLFPEEFSAETATATSFPDSLIFSTMVDVVEHVTPGLRQLLGPLRHFAQFLQHGALRGRDAVHPPRANCPTAGADSGVNSTSKNFAKWFTRVVVAESFLSCSFSSLVLHLLTSRERGGERRTSVQRIEPPTARTTKRALIQRVSHAI
jgi:hypothetical protein